MIGEDIELRISLEERLVKIQADAAQIDQIVMNLAVNARDAMQQGGIITLRTANGPWTAPIRKPLFYSSRKLRDAFSQRYRVWHGPANASTGF